MANHTGKSLVTLLLGAALGAAVGYMLYTDQEGREEDMDSLKEKIKDLKTEIKSKLQKKGEDLEQEIYNS